jgi:glycosyltransferase involved in cell wall biosynthesis
MENISVIVPCYHAGKRLPNCLTSIEHQTCKEIEAIFVDDASPDDTFAVLQRFQESHPHLRIKLVQHQQNQGVSSSRNDGLAAATGTYVTFLDADDSLAPDFCQSLLEFAVEHQLDIVACNGKRTDLQGNVLRDIYRDVSTKKASSLEVATSKDLQAFFDSCWGKIYRRDFLLATGLRFLSGMTYGEDTLFAHTAFLKTERIGFLGSYFGYQYVFNPSSCSERARVEVRLDNLQTLVMELKKEVPDAMGRVLLRKCQE